MRLPLRFSRTAAAVVGLALAGLTGLAGCSSSNFGGESRGATSADYNGNLQAEMSPGASAPLRDEEKRSFDLEGGDERGEDRSGERFLAGGPADDTLAIDDDGSPVRPRESPGKTPGETAVEPGRSVPLLIYTANLDLAVFQVQAIQKKVVALAKALGGFLSRQDGNVVVIRIPARRFEAALDRIEGFGDVINRRVEAKDVTEEFRDQTIRLRNLEVVRARLETLLQKADKVKDALEVQRELARITGQIESIKGRLRFMEDRIAFSTISVHFQPRPQNDAAGAAPSAFHLPFEWVHDLGLRSLMDVR